jgi:drug/metabolite transporter (DMT)-like permease
MTNGDTKSGSISADGDSSAIPATTILGAFAAFIILGSGASLAIRFTYGELAPYWSGVLRFGAAALIFWALLLIRRVPLPRGRALFGAALFGFLSVGAAFLFVYYGLTKTQASLYQTTMAIVPLLTLFFAAAHKLEVLRRPGRFRRNPGRSGHRHCRQRLSVGRRRGFAAPYPGHLGRRGLFR